MFLPERMSDMAENPAQVLVVEDEPEIRELVSLLLLRQGHKVQQCGSALEALESLKKDNFDLMVLDWMLPNMSGVELLRSLGQRASGPPVLMLTAKAEPTDIVQGLEAGADDYITKPFEPNVFTARIKALLRRSKQLQTPVAAQAAPSEIIRLGNISINTSSYEVRCGAEIIHLTPSEFKILTCMGENQGRVMTRDQLIEIVQGEGISVTGRTVDTHVFGLRKKLGDCSEQIETIRGVGYRVKAGD